MYRMPTVFGPATGPRRGPEDRKFECLDNPKSTSITVAFRTVPDQLMSLLPERFELGELPVVTVTATYMKDIEWLAGRGYNTLGVTFPAVYRGHEETVRGPFLAVLWENLTDPIITGREELGFAKLYCSLPEPMISGSSASCSANWLGFEFMNMEVNNLEQQTMPARQDSARFDGVLHYKYIPCTGEWGTADACYAVITPEYTPNRKVIEQWSGEGTIRWNHAQWEDMPTQYNVVNGIADLEVVEFIGGSVTRTIGGKDLSDQRILR